MSDLDLTASRLAALLTGGADDVRDPTRRDLVFETDIELESLVRGDVPADVWAVDGGQALVADARCLQLYVTRAATVRWQGGVSVLEDAGELRPHLLGGGEEHRSLAVLRSPVAPGAAVDVNLLRDWGEWEAVARAVETAERGALVLVDGDLQPDWRIPARWVGALFQRASARGVRLAGVTKHSSLSVGGAPLLGVLEQRAEERFGSRACWWAKVAVTRPELGAGLIVVVARLDPDAPFAFRIDLPGSIASGLEPAGILGQLSALADDAAFPGYPYPLTVADRLAACPGWVRAEVWDRVQAVLDRAGVPPAVRERAFADRHRLMERS
jgi:hypothetical protein